MKTFLKVFAPAIFLIVGLLATYLLLLALKLDTISFTFIIGFPFISSIVILRFRPQGTCQTLIGSVVWLLVIMLAAITIAVCAGFEGMLCIAMAIFPIIIGILAGGVFYVVFLRWRKEARGALNVVSLPIIAFLSLSFFQPPPAEYVISNSILINAAPDRVFMMIKSIPDISPDEISTRLPHLLGIPKPTAAVWEENQNGAIRHSHWGGGVHFLERITGIEANKRIAWDFEFPDGWIEEGIEDHHIKVGGHDFDVLSGEYTLEKIDGMTRLTLMTRTYDNSGLGFYAEFWHRFFFERFHESILELVKMRIENEGNLKARTRS